MRTTVLLLILSVLMTSCDAIKPAAGEFTAVKKAITSQTWLLQDENGTVVSYNGQDVTMAFKQESTGLQASGFAGCNRYFSNVDLQPGSIKFNQPAATLMACPDMEGEDAFLRLIVKVNAYEISGNELKLYQNKILLLRFKTK